MVLDFTVWAKTWRFCSLGVSFPVNHAIKIFDDKEIVFLSERTHCIQSTHVFLHAGPSPFRRCLCTKSVKGNDVPLERLLWWGTGLSVRRLTLCLLSLGAGGWSSWCYTWRPHSCWQPLCISPKSRSSPGSWARPRVWNKVQAERDGAAFPHTLGRGVFGEGSPWY